MNNDLISRSALIETINKISFYSVHNGEFIEGAGLNDVAYYRERDIYRAIIDAPSYADNDTANDTAQGGLASAT